VETFYFALSSEMLARSLGFANSGYGAVRAGLHPSRFDAIGWEGCTVVSVE
jgi:hypothetical protein